MKESKLYLATLIATILIGIPGIKTIKDYQRTAQGYLYAKDMQTIDSKKLENTIEIENIKNNQLSSNEYFLTLFRYKTLNKIDSSYEKTIKNINTIEETMFYCSEYLTHGGESIDSIQYNKDDYWASFKKIHKSRIDDCEGGAFAAAALLKDNGFPPYMIILKGSNNKKTNIHALFIYKTDEHKYGSISINKAENLYPRYSLEELIQKINENSEIDYNEYQIFNINKFAPGFINNNKNNAIHHRYSKYIKIKSH